MSDKKIEVVALREGYYSNTIRSPGEKFDVSEKDLGSWMKKVEVAPEIKKEVKAKKGEVAPEIKKEVKAKKVEVLSELI